MKLRLSFRIFNIRFLLSVRKVHRPVGACSKLENGKHILMWDFDGVDYQDAEQALREVIRRENLSDVYLLQSSGQMGFHAYCFSSFDFNDALRIVASTRHIENMFIRLGAVRGYLTLRITATEKRPQPQLRAVLAGRREADATTNDINLVIKYETIKA